MDRFVVISGCSSGGKSTLLQALRERGFATVEEPGRRIVKEEIERGGTALPWIDANAFLSRAIETSLADLAMAARMEGWVFFDRGLIDAAAGLERLTGAPTSMTLRTARRFHRQVFLAPPWPEIYVTDRDRRHGLDQAAKEYAHLLNVYPALGYEVFVLPKVSVSDRADFVLRVLSNE